MTNIESLPVGEIVAKDYRAATILKGHKIDFCCQGGVSLAEACKKKDVSIWEVLSQLNKLESQENDHIEFQDWPADLLCDYIEKKHHRYVKHRLEEIPPFLKKVARVHGSGYPELLKIIELFLQASSNLLQHMEKEEKFLFPLIREVLQNDELKNTETLESLQAQLREEHQVEGERFAQIAALSNDYNPPKEACNTYRVTYALLKEFEDDLHQHIHLENNILFSKVMALKPQNH